MADIKQLKDFPIITKSEDNVYLIVEENGAAKKIPLHLLPTANVDLAEINGRLDALSEEIADLKENGTGSGGLTTNAITLLTDVLRHALYLGDYDSEATITALAAELAKSGSGSGGDSGGDDGNDDVSIFAITYNLTNTICSVNATTIAAGSVFSANLTAEDGYNLSEVTVTMGGEDVTANVYADGVISIGAVTGNIVITARSQSGTVIMVNGEYTYKDNNNLLYTAKVTDNKTIEFSNFSDCKQIMGPSVLDATQTALIMAANGIVANCGSDTTKFSVATGDVITLNVTVDSVNFQTGYIIPHLCTPSEYFAMPNINGITAVTQGNTYTSTLTAESNFDVTELLLVFRYFGNTSDFASSSIKLTLSLKVNDVEVLGV